ncbi:hypothetical protein T09_7240 [Trichinella sp. T9]|nr:hypothetical protein T09_7240 [Trichinella sp. T9]
MLRSVVFTEFEDDARQNVLFYEILCRRTTLYQRKINYEVEMKPKVNINGKVRMNVRITASPFSRSSVIVVQK